ncbi:SDR family oxidoreductase [Rubrobacter tropicus]|uniref:SDR family oxidoreductase n=1 Tax=Rubrobacter tropicus TaxID=2653851 RepID=A0A6G8Q4X1_9ACTN|nr:SDR family oxidoreductase [Rubrobacter tropicus]QIN81544.1 SDR family oxidoreductase [Rubrobacter tropicus]
MTEAFLGGLFDLSGRVAAVTGATGTLGGEMARGLARAGAKVGVLGRREERAARVVAEIEAAGGEAMALPADVLDRGQLEAARDALVGRWGGPDILVNAAGGNVPEATVSGGMEVFDLPEEALRRVFDLNLIGTVLPVQVFGEAMAQGTDPGGSIVNVSSMAAQRPLTNVVGYSAAKAAVESFTRWTAVELARKYGAGLRVNALAPGFFLGEQNRAMLVDESGGLTERGRQIVDHTPAGRFGEPDELVGALIFLCSPAARFVTGVVVPVDGGFGAFSGV